AVLHLRDGHRRRVLDPGRDSLGAHLASEPLHALARRDHQPQGPQADPGAHRRFRAVPPQGRDLQGPDLNGSRVAGDHAGMNTSDTPAAHEPLWNACRDLASTVTSMHPHAAKVADEAARGEILKALFEIT